MKQRHRLEKNADGDVAAEKMKIQPCENESESQFGFHFRFRALKEKLRMKSDAELPCSLSAR